VISDDVGVGAADISAGPPDVRFWGINAPNGRFGGMADLFAPLLLLKYGPE
jgi:hypothetical protein